jgi:hypothetical protein
MKRSGDGNGLRFITCRPFPVIKKVPTRMRTRRALYSESTGFGRLDSIRIQGATGALQHLDVPPNPRRVKELTISILEELEHIILNTDNYITFGLLLNP